MIDVVLCYEGVTDFEPLCILMKKAADPIELSVTPKTRGELKKDIWLLKKRTGIHPRITSVDRFVMAAVKYGYTHIAYHMDADHDYQARYKDIADRLAPLQDKIHGLAVVPKEMIESWLMADTQAFAALYKKAPVRPELPKAPENLWGEEKNPDSNFPKNVMKRVLKQYHAEPNRQVFADIAGFSDISTLRAQCPLSFERFYQDMQMFIRTNEPEEESSI